jgi:hypothetical protein
MNKEEEILNQLQSLNQKFDKYLNPKKLVWQNFLFGLLRALGYLFGTAIIASLIIYILSQSKIGQSIKTWVETNQPTYQISVPSPDQP